MLFKRIVFDTSNNQNFTILITDIILEIQMYELICIFLKSPKLANISYMQLTMLLT